MRESESVCERVREHERERVRRSRSCLRSGIQGLGVTVGIKVCESRDTLLLGTRKTFRVNCLGFRVSGFGCRGLGTPAAPRRAAAPCSPEPTFKCLGCRVQGR